MHATVVDHGAKDHNNRSYKVCMTKIDCIITRTGCHIKQTPISTEQYLQGKLNKVRN